MFDLQVSKYLFKWASNDGQIIQLGLSDNGRAKFIPAAVGGVLTRFDVEGQLLKPRLR